MNKQLVTRPVRYTYHSTIDQRFFKVSLVQSKHFITNVIIYFQITCHDNKDGTVSVSYLPTAPGEYKVAVRFGDKHIKGSPFIAKVSLVKFS